jgi:hypothetical protein
VTALRLTWEHVPESEDSGPAYWHADEDFALGMCVMEYGEHYEWFVCGKNGVEHTVEAAQLAAEAAALALLVEALAVYACETTALIQRETIELRGTPEYTLKDSRGSATIGHLSPDDLVAWGHALICTEGGWVMARSPALTALLAKYGIVTCGWPACIFGGPAGVRSCGCIVTLGETPARSFYSLAAIIRELDQQPEQIAAWLEREAAASGLFHVQTTLGKAAEFVRAGRWKEKG